MKENRNPPAWVDSLLEKLAPADLAEEIKGDLHELFFKEANVNGLPSAQRRYVFNGLGFLARRFFWKNDPYNNPNPFMMLSSYFTMARRSLLFYKGNTIINTLGLVTGIASALVMLTVIRYELSFDTFHSNSDRIYRVVRVTGTDLTISERSECRTGVSYPVPAALKEGIPSLENITSMEYFGGVQVDIPDQSGAITRKFREAGGCVIVEPSFFKVFDFKGTDFKWIEGNPEKALNEPFNVVLTKTQARKYFPEGTALGKTLRFEKRYDGKVTGVIEDLPPNTDFPFTILISYVSIKSMGGDQDSWLNVADEHQTYVILSPGTTKEEMEKQIAKVHAAHTNKELSESRHYLLQKLDDVHYDPRFGNYNGRTISRQTVMALELIALFLLLTGCINYINLATAQSTMRSKEIGLRKVMGSNPRNLVAQLMTETFVVVFIAGVIALGLAQLILPSLQSLLNVKLTRLLLADPFILASLLSIIAIVTLLSGFYPSLIMSRFNPVTALKNKFTTEAVAGISLRKVLVVTQFTITQILVLGTFIVVSQMRFFDSVDMGFNKNAIITMPIPGRDPERLKVMEDQLRSEAFVSGVTFSSTLPSGLNRDRSSMDIGHLEAASMKDYHVFEYQVVDPSYLDVYQIKLLAGRNLTIQDTSGNILINKTLVKVLQLGSPEQAVGMELKMGGKVTVVGVIDDFFSNSVKESVDNMALAINPKRYRNVSIKLNLQGDHGSAMDAVRRIEKIWTATYPESIFDFQFFDENIRAFYAQEQKYAQLFQLFSIVFLLIGCLGLYGLITFVVNRKSKEVAIRKVLGATLTSILMMFSKEYVQLIILSFVLAVPVAYYAVDSWLGNFAHHIELNGWLFVVPGVLVLIIALIVVGAKSAKAANRNPVESLRTE
jgi:ABC-type antimicrobial peptide transport system permease subunit